MRTHRGQIAVVLVFALAVLVLLTLLNVDTFLAVRAKNRVQNAGDAAALAAARKQGSLLNEIGRLNIAHLIAAARSETDECRRIVMEQRRLALLGPVDALALANDAAKKNGMQARDEFGAILRAHVADIRLVYAGGGGGDGDPYPEPFPGAWTEYATRIESVAGEGLATGPDNIEFYDAAGGHLLLNREFYHAIAGRDWCWFFFHCYGVLSSYTGYGDWAPLPLRRDNPMDNSEIFSLHVVSKPFSLTDLFSRDEMRKIVERYSEVRLTDEELGKSDLLSDPEEPWFLFDSGMWRRWFNGMSLADDEDGGEFPLAGEIKEEYNVRGCAAVCRCQKAIGTVAIDSEPDFVWSAAAKPFGTVEDVEGVGGPVTGLKNFIVPGMTAVRLVPLDSVGGGNLATADYGWVVHIRNHLGPYLEDGKCESGCFWCMQLKTWERDSFRREGVRWLKYNSHTCRRGTGGGGGHGGTSHGH
ncbi:MAG: hypothetical protein K6F50_06360 [Kiritimatiellae bacterium]|nr:hypothetical protein [Kiritimatiellia bacterium]